MPRKKSKGVFSIRIRKDGYAEYRTAANAEELAKPSSDLVGKFHSKVANYDNVEANWRKDAEKKGLTEVKESE